MKSILCMILSTYVTTRHILNSTDSCSFHFDLSNFAVILKVGQGDKRKVQNSKGVIIMKTFKYLSYTFFEKKPILQFLSPSVVHMTRVNYFP